MELDEDEVGLEISNVKEKRKKKREKKRKKKEKKGGKKEETRDTKKRIDTAYTKRTEAVPGCMHMFRLLVVNISVR